MIIINKPMGKGKTTDIINWVKDGRIPNIIDSSDRIIGVHSEQIKQSLIRNCDLGYHEVETYETLVHGYYHPTLRNKEVMIDNIEEFLGLYFSHIPIVGFSVTTEEKPELLPCPMCGHTPMEEVNTNEVDNFYYVKCACGIQTGKYRHKDTAKERWNTRR